MRRLNKLRKKATTDAKESAPAEAAESTVILNVVDSQSPQWLLWQLIANVKESDIDNTLNEINTYLTQITLS